MPKRHSHKSNNGSAGPVILLSLFAIAILALCAVVIAWNAGRPKPPDASAPQSASQAHSAAVPQPAPSGGTAPSSPQKPASSGAAASTSASLPASAAQSAPQSGADPSTPTPSPGPNGTYLLNNEDDIRAAAYAQMNADDQAAVLANWKTAAIRTVGLRGAMGEISDLSYVGLEVYELDFRRGDKPDTVPGNVLVYLAKDTGKLIGFGFVD